MLKWEPLKEGNKKSSLKCDCCFAQISLTKVNPDFQFKIHHQFSNFFCRDGNGAKGRVHALTGKEYFSWLDFDIATALHPPKDEFLFERSYANRNVHIPYLAALNLFLTLINCSADYKGTINMWGHAEEEIMLGFYEAAKFLQPCLLSAFSHGLAAGIAVCVAELLLPYLVFLVDEKKSFLWIFKVPKIVLRHFILHRGGRHHCTHACFHGIVLMRQPPTACAPDFVTGLLRELRILS